MLLDIPHTALRKSSEGERRSQLLPLVLGDMAQSPSTSPYATVPEDDVLTDDDMYASATGLAHYLYTEDQSARHEELKWRAMEAVAGGGDDGAVPSPRLARRRSLVYDPANSFTAPGTPLRMVRGVLLLGVKPRRSDSRSSTFSSTMVHGDLLLLPAPLPAVENLQEHSFDWLKLLSRFVLSLSTEGPFLQDLLLGPLAEEVNDDIADTCRSVRWCLELRHRYQQLLLQYDGDNPKNLDGWEILPKPPMPVYNAKEFDSKYFKQKEAVPKGNDGFDFAQCTVPGDDALVEFTLTDEGVFEVREAGELVPLVKLPTLRDYYIDLEKLCTISGDGPNKSFAFKRLEYLEAKWNLYLLVHDYQETSALKQNPHRDFYNVRKVDTHVHHSACMNQKHLLRFIKHKMRHSPDEEVIYRDGRVLLLAQVFELLNLTAYDLLIDTLDMHAHKDTFHRFDKFNLKYNPIGELRLREIFLKTDNFIQGRYLAEVTQEVLDDLEQSKYQMAEYRILVYGRLLEEWDRLAAWIVDNKLVLHNVRWLIQVPRLYDVYKKAGTVHLFHDVVRNVFQPLFEVSKNPQLHPKLHVFLQRVVGFDSVDDELKPDRRSHRKYPAPRFWEVAANPPYSYYLYYLYANIATLNGLRKRRGFNTLVFRPHCGEAGDPEHLAAAFMVAQGISHGILLRKLPFIQYLYYLDQIGIAMSPLLNNALFLTYDKNPFPDYFKRGLNVLLLSDDPLQFLYTREPLIEEYLVAAQIYKLLNVDMCELAANSVEQLGFEAALKKHWLGEHYNRLGVEGNQVDKLNVPDVRRQYRFVTLMNEYRMLDEFGGGRSAAA